MQRLIAAQQAAREGSLDALQGQRARMLADRPMSRRQLLPTQNEQRLLEDVPVAALQKQLTFPLQQPRNQSLRAPRRSESLPVAPPSSLYCRYSDILQYSSRALSPAFEPSADSRCPSCDVALPVDTRDVWVFTTETSSGKVREYSMDSRFVVKCHMRDGRFACVLCNQHRDMDCLCRTVEGLVRHLASKHTLEEFEEEVDLVGAQNVIEERKLLAY